MNSYGSSEVVETSRSRRSTRPPPIRSRSTPVPGTEILVLDAALRPTRWVWSAKSMSLQHNRARLPTQAGSDRRTVRGQPFGTGRLFRTGDIGCWDSNGDLSFTVAATVR